MIRILNTCMELYCSQFCFPLQGWVCPLLRVVHTKTSSALQTYLQARVLLRPARNHSRRLTVPPTKLRVFGEDSHNSGQRKAAITSKWWTSTLPCIVNPQHGICGHCTGEQNWSVSFNHVTPHWCHKCQGARHNKVNGLHCVTGQ